MTERSSVNIISTTGIILGCKKGRVTARKKTTPVRDLQPIILKENPGSLGQRQNLSVKAGFIRILFIPALACSAAIAWFILPFYIIILVPTAFYMIVTALTFYCPVKDLARYLIKYKDHSGSPKFSHKSQTRLMGLISVKD